MILISINGVSAGRRWRRRKECKFMIMAGIGVFETGSMGSLGLVGHMCPVEGQT